MSVCTKSWSVFAQQFHFSSGQVILLAHEGSGGFHQLTSTLSIGFPPFNYSRKLLGYVSSRHEWMCKFNSINLRFIDLHVERLFSGLLSLFHFRKDVNGWLLLQSVTRVLPRSTPKSIWPEQYQTEIGKTPQLKVAFLLFSNINQSACSTWYARLSVEQQS